MALLEDRAKLVRMMRSLRTTCWSTLLLAAGCASGRAPAAGPGAAISAPAPPGGGSSSACAADGLVFCEDFESYPEGPAASARWSKRGNGTLAIDASKRAGAKTLHVHTQDNGHAMLSIPFSPPANSHFGRLRVWIDAFPTAPDWAHFTMVEASGDGPGVVRPLGGQQVAGKGGQSFWGVGADKGPTGDWTRWRLTAPTRAQAWLCLEWEMRADDNAVNVWIDGIAQPDLTVSTSSHGGKPVDFVFPRVNRLLIGWWEYQRGTRPEQFDLWIDDVALGTRRIGCG
jgi:hypothetical protein